MKNTTKHTTSQLRGWTLFLFLACMLVLGSMTYKNNVPSERFSFTRDEPKEVDEVPPKKDSVFPLSPILDKVRYDSRMLTLANIPKIKVATSTVVYGTSSASSTTVYKDVYISATSSNGWPVKAVYPNPGALLPFNRIIAYYGNFYSKRMGILGEYDSEVVIQKLRDEVKAWNEADPSTPVIPAIHYIVAVAQADKGSDGDYLARMPDIEIQKALTMAEEVKGIVFLDIQFGHSTILSEVSAIKEYLKLPQVHLGLDPEFMMKNKKQPGTSIGTMDAVEINEAIEFLSKIVRENNLPPKILMVHRFTENMVTNYQNIKPTPEVQVIMNMDGWGSPELKMAMYKHVAYPEPVQFTGLKIFYKNDLRAPSTRLMTTDEVLNLSPTPIYIQYQ